MNTITFILGMHRSGTSALAGALHLAGLEIGNLQVENKSDNPKGYFENKTVVAINDLILREQNCNWHMFLGPEIVVREESEAHAMIEHFLKNVLALDQPFLIKDPRLCMTFGYWRRAAENLGIPIHVLLLFRNPVSVADSLERRNGFSQAKSFMLWVQHVLNADLLSRNLSRSTIHFEEFIKNPAKELTRLQDSIRASLTIQANKKLSDFINPSQVHGTVDLSALKYGSGVLAGEVYEVIKKLRDDGPTVVLRKLSRKRREFVKHARLISEYFEYRVGQLQNIINTKMNLSKTKYSIKYANLLDEMKKIHKNDYDLHELSRDELERYATDINIDIANIEALLDSINNQIFEVFRYIMKYDYNKEKENAFKNIQKSRDNIRDKYLIIKHDNHMLKLKYNKLIKEKYEAQKAYNEIRLEKYNLFNDYKEARKGKYEVQMRYNKLNIKRREMQLKYNDLNEKYVDLKKKIEMMSKG